MQTTTPWCSDRSGCARAVGLALGASARAADRWVGTPHPAVIRPNQRAHGPKVPVFPPFYVESGAAANVAARPVNPESGEQPQVANRAAER
jgi:hypothetical protein